MNKPDSFYKIGNLRDSELTNQIKFVEELSFDVDNYYDESYNRTEHFPQCVSHPIIDQYNPVSDDMKFTLSISHLIKTLRMNMDQVNFGKFYRNYLVGERY